MIADVRTPGNDDDALLTRVANGDEHALGALYDRWSPLVFSLCVHILGDDDEAEEAVEETFWQAWRQAARYDTSRGAVSTWLTTIARSRALDRLRASRRRKEDAMTDLSQAKRMAVETTARGEDDPARGAEVAERRVLVRQALRALPAEQREVLELAYFRGLSQTEIAERTGQPLGTIKTRVRLAMEKLRDRLGILREREP
ncbi:MAG TPA: sigma-70 family RNA polymerase sigma factor [Gemmatimonadaceae bacterium]|nr:sigma-70 family RNA polymerase sigma factor [Gemmatimonadaceae bacterium]